jgi:MFS family permease
VNRNIWILSAASFLMSFGEELWKRFLPKYLESLGAPVTGIGLYGTLKDFIDGVYQYPGGWVTDHYGSRRALLLFVTIAQYGLLVAVQMTTAIAVYIPAAKFGDRIGRNPFVIATFVFFAAYPLSIVLASGMAGLVAAFIVGGLREIGEPSRKAMIVNFAVPEYRGRIVGLYYLVRSLSIAPAAFIGGLLWKVSPTVPFFVAAAVGISGTVVFTLTVRE